jgi:hypothetical protein
MFLLINILYLWFVIILLLNEGTAPLILDVR